MGAAVQGALIAGVDVGPVLVDITPHTLGIQCLGELYGSRQRSRCSRRSFSRNTPLPATRSEIYYTVYDGQDEAEIHVLQGEHDVATLNESVGRFMLEGLNEEASEGNEILVRFDLDLNGMLKVTARERDTGLSKEVTIDNAVTRFRAASSKEAKLRLAEIFEDMASEDMASEDMDGSESLLTTDDVSASAEQFAAAQATLAKARRLLPQASPEDADEMRPLISQLEQAIAACPGGACAEDLHAARRPGLLPPGHVGSPCSTLRTTARYGAPPARQANRGGRMPPLQVRFESLSGGARSVPVVETCRSRTAARRALTTTHCRRLVSMRPCHPIVMRPAGLPWRNCCPAGRAFRLCRAG